MKLFYESKCLWQLFLTHIFQLCLFQYFTLIVLETQLQSLLNLICLRF